MRAKQMQQCITYELRLEVCVVYEQEMKEGVKSS